MKRTVVMAGLALSLVMLNAASAGMLYGVDDGANRLISIDPDSLAVTIIGSLGVGSGDFGDLTYDEASGTMWWIAGRGNNSLYTVNLATGAATLVGAHGIDDLFALGTVDGNLYGQDTAGDIYELDTTTGAPTFFGHNSVYPGGFDWNPDAEQMILLASGAQGVFSVDETGAATLLANPGFVNDNDIAYDGDRGVFWSADWSNLLYQYDASWNRTLMAEGLPLMAALEYVSDGAPAPTVPAPGALLLAGTGLLGVLRARRRLAA